MPDNFETYTKEYADAAGLRPTDMPSSHHPLLESNDEVRELSDLIDVRDASTSALRNGDIMSVDDPDLDIEEALTLPHKSRPTTSADRTETLSDMDADALTPGDPDDEDDASYMTRADVEDAMDETDPDPNVGADRSEYIGDAGIDRAPDMSGTVTGIARGMSTHLPQDLGAGGFQIMDAEDMEGSRIDDEEAAILDKIDPDDPYAPGDVIPTPAPNINNRDDALDATRQLR